MKVLFLGCHCDDIELGCGGTIYKHRNDWDIYCCVLSSEGYNEERKLIDISDISRRSLVQLGVKNSYFGKFKPGCFSKHRQDIFSFLLRFKTLIDPDIIITQFKDEHQDHVTLYEESNRIFRESNLISYLSTFKSLRFFKADIFEILDEEMVNHKLSALDLYKDFYSSKNYFNIENIKAQLRTNAIYINKEFSENYKTITKIGI